MQFDYEYESRRFLIGLGNALWMSAVLWALIFKAIGVL